MIIKSEYNREAIGKTLCALVTIGAREGYAGQREFSLQEITKKVEEVNVELQNIGIKPLNCILSESVLVGRAGQSNYREKLYNLRFAWSPRSGPSNKDIFFETTEQYAFRLGKKMNQERVYLEFERNTYVFKKK